MEYTQIVGIVTRQLEVEERDIDTRQSELDSAQAVLDRRRKALKRKRTGFDRMMQGWRSLDEEVVSGRSVRPDESDDREQPDHEAAA